MIINSFIHTSDFHIYDKHKWSVDGSRLNQIIENANEIVDCAIQNKVPLIIIAGDVFNNHNPSEYLLREFAVIIRKATDSGIVVRVIVGNHDTNGINHSLESLKSISGIISDELFKVIDEPYSESYDNVNFCYMPHQEKMNQAISNIEKPPDGLNVLVTHGAVNGAWATVKYKFQSNTGIELSVLDHWDYVALGDFHKNQKVGKKGNIWYCGSIVKLSWNEREEKFFNYVILEDIKVLVQPIPLYDVSFIETTLDTSSLQYDIGDTFDELTELDGRSVTGAFIKVFIDKIDHNALDYKRALYNGGASEVYLIETGTEASIENEDVSLDLDFEEAVRNSCGDKELLKYGMDILKEAME